MSIVRLETLELSLGAQSFGDIEHGDERHVELLGRRGVGHREYHVPHPAIEREDLGLFDVVASPLEVGGHDTLRHVGRCGEQIADRPNEVCRASAAEQRHSLAIDLRHPDDVLGQLDQFGMGVEEGRNVGHALRPQPVEDFACCARINLPERGRHVMDQLAIAILAGMQFPGGTIVAQDAVDHEVDGVGATLIQGAPSRDGGIAEKAFGLQGAGLSDPP